ncbi:MAG: type VI secretion system contractile sheath large subunit, partial [Pseudomonadota bacterium]
DASRVDGIAGAQTASDAVEPERSDGAVPDTQRFAGSNAPAAEEPILSEDDQADHLVSDLDDLLADLEEPDEKAVSETSSVDTPQAVTAGAQITAPNGAVSEGNGAADDMMSELDDLLADLDAPDEAEADARPVGDAGVGTRDLGPSDADQVLADDPTDDLMSDLDELLADLDAPDEPREDALAAGADALTADLDDLLADLEDDTDTASRPAPPEKAEPAAVPSKPPAIVAEDVDADGLDDLLEEADMARDAPKAQAVAGFGTVGAARFDRTALNRKSFRIAVFGDFTGRSSRGVIETGEALATRPAIPLDVDDIEEMIEGFATTLTLPIGKDRAGIEVKLGELDDLHPDELFDSVEIFQELSGLRQQLDMGSMASQAVERLKDWGATYGTPVRVPKRSASTAVPADRKLSDFQALIGDTEARLVQPSPVEEMIARIVGPYAVKAPDAGVDAMKAAVDEALSAAMRLILHHPDFQAVEAQWRTLDLLARRIETGADLELVLYDVSAEELAVDLSAGEDLAQSGFLRLLTSVLDPEIGPGGFSALVGLYTFEETPPHAELLGRIAQVAAHVDAPFLTALSPAYLETAKTDRHPLVAQAWERLRGLPEASYVALASPRFMLRLPYGKTSERISTFKFEEFTPQEGLSGMLWANPAALVAILLAQTYTQAGTVDAMALGSVMSLDDVPFFYMTDGFGDQVALPCTERNLTADMAQSTLLRGVMPVLSIKGRNEIRLGSFRAVSGQELAGRWSDAQAAPTGKGTAPTLEFEVDFPTEAAESAAARGAEGSSLGAEASSNAADDDMSLDDLLASFGDDTDDDGGDDDDMDPELAELLKGL